MLGSKVYVYVKMGIFTRGKRTKHNLTLALNSLDGLTVFAYRNFGSYSIRANVLFPFNVCSCGTSSFSYHCCHLHKFSKKRILKCINKCWECYLNKGWWKRNKTIFLKTEYPGRKICNIRIKVLKKIDYHEEVKDDCGNEVDIEIKVEAYLRLRTWH